MKAHLWKREWTKIVQPFVWQGGTIPLRHYIRENSGSYYTSRFEITGVYSHIYCVIACIIMVCLAHQGIKV